MDSANMGVSDHPVSHQPARASTGRRARELPAVYCYLGIKRQQKSVISSRTHLSSAALKGEPDPELARAQLNLMVLLLEGGNNHCWGRVQA
jgi:hypothetical protein